MPLNILPLAEGRYALVATSGFNSHDLAVVDRQRHFTQDLRGPAEGIYGIELEQHLLVLCISQAESGTPSRMLATSLFALISSGVPWARNRPSCIITMRSE